MHTGTCRNVVRSGMSREFYRCPRLDNSSVNKALEVGLMHICKAVHRSAYSDLKSFRRYFSILNPAVSTGHCGSSDGKLTESSCHTIGVAWHPLSWIEIANFSNDS